MRCENWGVVLRGDMTIGEIIDREGGATAFSRKTGIPLRTSEDWKAGRRSPPAWLVPILNDWLKMKRKSK